MNILTFDFETSKKPRHLPWIPGSFAVSLGILRNKVDISIRDCGGYNEYILNHKDSYPTWSQENVQWKFDWADEIVGHNICFDLHWLKACGIILKPNIRIYDTMIAEYLLSGQTKKYDELSLADLSEQYLSIPKDDEVKPYWDAGIETDEIPLPILMPYMKRDIINTMELYELQQPRIQEKGMEKLVRLQSELVGVVEEMEWNGMRVDVDSCKTKLDSCIINKSALETELTMFIEDVLPELRDIPIKWTSGDHLSTILFGGKLVYDGREKTERRLKDGTIRNGERNAKLVVTTRGLGFKPGKRTETKKAGYYQTDKAQMEQLQPKGKAQRRFLDLLSEISSVEKLSGTYFKPFIEESIGGVFHPNYNQTATVTGRLTCSRLHQIPRDDDKGVKSVFITGEE